MPIDNHDTAGGDDEDGSDTWKLAVSVCTCSDETGGILATGEGERASNCGAGPMDGDVDSS